MSDWFLFFLLLICPFAVLNTSLLCWRLGSLGACSFVLRVWGWVFELKGQSCEAPGDVLCEKAWCGECLIHPHLIFMIVVTLITILRWGHRGSGRWRYKLSIHVKPRGLFSRCHKFCSGFICIASGRAYLLCVNFSFNLESQKPGTVYLRKG